jgi:hypothetical protein
MVKCQAVLSNSFNEREIEHNTKSMHIYVEINIVQLKRHVSSQMIPTYDSEVNSCSLSSL